MGDPSEPGGSRSAERSPQSVLGEPLGQLGAPVALQHLIAEAPGTRVILREAKVFPEGARLEITLVASRLEDAETWVREQFFKLRYGRSRAAPGALRFRVEFEDGSSADTSTRQEDGARGLVLVGGSSAATSDAGTARVEYRLWLAPLPPAAPFTLSCGWADRLVDEASVTLSGAELRAAASWRSGCSGQRSVDAEVGLADLGVGEELVGVVGQDDLAGLQDVAAVGEPEAPKAFCSTISTMVPRALISVDDRSRAHLHQHRREAQGEGSSSISRRGRATRPRLIASICCSPLDKVPPTCLRRVAQAGNSSWTRSGSAGCRTFGAFVGAHVQVLLGRHVRQDAPAPGALPRLTISCDGRPWIVAPRSESSPRAPASCRRS